MSREDRLARLEALLARVRANAAARGARPRSHLSIPPEPLPEELEGIPPLPIFVPALRPTPPPDETTLEALSQRALALTTSDALVVAATPPPAEERWPESIRPAPADVQASPSAPEEPAASFLERAVRDAAAEQLPASLFREAAEELREHERRTATELVAAEDGGTLAHEPTAPDDPAVGPTDALTRDPWFTEDEPPPPARPIVAPLEPPARSYTLWVGAAAGAALVLSAALLIRSERAPPKTAPGPERIDGPVAATPASGPRPAPLGAIGPSANAPSAHTPAPPPPPPAAPSALTSTPVDAPDTATLGRDRGLLWVDTKSPREVFVQGNAVGASGRWLTVPCGLRNVRTAQPGPPPAGSSFPIWTSDGHSVLVPCQSSTRVTLPTDP